DQVAALEARLIELAGSYRQRFGIDVAAVPGSGAAGGLAGALVALGARTCSGAEYVAAHIGLEAALVGADLVVTAEGAIDEGTLSGKVVDVVLSTRPDVPALLVGGVVDAGAVERLRARRSGSVDVAVLSTDRQRRLGTAGAIHEAVGNYLSS
ncbi:MAG TPA: glycerate kinase, partial [Acidimicrobiales bacterium]